MSAARGIATFALVLGLVAPATAPARSTGNDARVNYMLHCQGCHREGGIGHPGIVPNLQGEVGRFLASPAGRRYLVQVPGVAQSSLDDAALADVLNWMLPAFDPLHVSADFERFTADEVARYRDTPIIDVSGIRRALLEGREPAGIE